MTDARADFEERTREMLEPSREGFPGGGIGCGHSRADAPGFGDQLMPGPDGPRGAAISDLKASVAVHREGCGCHPVTCKSFGPIEELGCCKRSMWESDAADTSGQPWHLDPSCRAR